MDLYEARQVLWLKSYHRPLGELLDEGYLTRSRLEWAVKRAYNPKLRQASQVLLDAMNTPAPMGVEIPQTVADPALPIDIPLDKARVTLWPFAPYKGQPMGPLVESKQLSLKDLGYAIENAWDEKVKKAAIALTLVRLEQAVKEPIPSAGFTRVVSGGRSYSERRQLKLSMFEGMFLGVLLCIVIALAAWLVQTFQNPPSTSMSVTEYAALPGGFLVLFLMAVGTIVAFWLTNFIPDLIIKRLDKQISLHRFGEEGEDQVAQLISQALDGNWTVFRNLELPGPNKGDLDIVLVGPPGVWVLEVKNFHGEYRNVGETWEYRRGSNWKTASVNPGRQANKNALRLKNILQADHLDVYVHAVVVWANGENPVQVENPSTAVWQYHRLADELGNIWQGEKLSKEERQKIVEKLTMVCERQTRRKAE